MKFNPLKILPKFWTKNSPPSTEIIPQQSPSELNRQAIESEEDTPKLIRDVQKWLNQFKKTPLLVVMFGGGFLIFTVVKPLELYEFWKNKLAAQTVPVSCKIDKKTNIQIQIPSKLKQQWGCHSIAQGIDATLTLKTNTVNSPQLQLLIDDIYYEDAKHLTISDVHDYQLCQAHNWSRNIIEYQLCKIQGINNKKIDSQGAFKFKNLDAYKLVYDNDKSKRLDLLFLYKGKQYIIRYEAYIKDFSKFEKKAQEIIDSLEINPDN